MQVFFCIFFNFENIVAILPGYRYNIFKKRKEGAAELFNVYSVPLTKLVKEFELEVANESSDYEKIQLTVADVARPGMQLAGYFDHFEPMRLQVMGNVEISYLQKLSEAERKMTLDRLYSYKLPALLVTRDNPLEPVCLDLAKKHDITVLRCKEATSTIVSLIIAYLSAALAHRITRHGVLMEIYGEGVLLMGESGMGKSEAAVELLKPGHRLISDDAVEIRKVSGSALIGNAPALIQNYVELRGIGIVNVAKLFGMGAIKSENEINLVVNIVPWKEHAACDRLGLEEQHMEILGVQVPMYTIPITPGRNLAVILEVAAMNNRQKSFGYNPAKEFTEQMDDHYRNLG